MVMLINTIPSLNLLFILGFTLCIVAEPQSGFLMEYWWTGENCTGEVYYVYGVEYEACSYYGSENKCWASTYYSYNCTDADKVFLDDIFPDGYVGFAYYTEEGCPKQEYSLLYAVTTSCVSDGYDGGIFITGECNDDDAYTKISYYYCDTDSDSCPIDEDACSENVMGTIYGSGCYSSSSISVESFCDSPYLC